MARDFIFRVKNGEALPPKDPSGYRVILTDSGELKLLGSDGSLNDISNLSSGGGSGTTASYKVYSALISQSGTDAPTAIILENTLSDTPVWSRTSGGDYRLTLAGEFTADKTVCMIGNVDSGLASGFLTPAEFTYDWIDANQVYINSNNGSTLTDSLLNKLYFEVRVYN